MRAGEVDFIIGSDTLDADSYQELSSTEGITGVISDFDFVTEFIALNDEVVPLNDINIRNAIQMACLLYTSLSWSASASHTMFWSKLCCELLR